MSAQPRPTVFLSHSHIDKRVARRLVRRLTAHGIKVWIDDRELRIGTTLSSSIRTQIQGVDVVLVVASQASAVAKWVGMELECAREYDKDVIPLFIESVADHERFRDYLGVDATSPQAFADVVHSVMCDLYRTFDRELPQPDPAVLSAELRALVKEEPDLAPLILGCLDSEGLPQESMDTAFNAPFHPLDEALNALLDVMPTKRIASHAAYGFCRAGAGTRALSSWIKATGDGDLPFVSAVGKRLDPALINTAITLLGSCDPPNNHALYEFIHHNAVQLDQKQHRAVLRLVTWPQREDTSRFADVLGWVALRQYPDAVEIRQMWVRWITTGSFDGTPHSTRDLARYLANANKEELRGWEDVNKAVRDHVRAYLRSRDRNKVVIAADHIQAAADTGAPVLESLLFEAEGVSCTSGWEQWSKRDPETAELMEWYVFEVSKEARGDRNWRRARDSAKQMVAFEEERRRILAEDEQEPNDPNQQ